MGSFLCPENPKEKQNDTTQQTSGEQSSLNYKSHQNNTKAMQMTACDESQQQLINKDKQKQQQNQPNNNSTPNQQTQSSNTYTNKQEQPGTNSQNQQKEMSLQQKNIALINKLEHKKLTTNDFQQVRALGKGAFGKVWLVSRNNKKNSSEQFAMKSIQKKELVRLNLIEATLLERNILFKNQSQHHPFLVELKYAFQSETKVYIIMEYVPGGDLYNLLKRVGKFNEEQARFIFAEVISGIQYLHQIKIIYRDLKPENILLTKDGHIKVSDFGLSKQFKETKDKTYTFAGTPEYLAPEIVLNKGHNKDADLWALGIFLFELLNGQPPFTDSKRNFNTIQKLITENKIVMPDHFSPEAKDIIYKLLKNEPDKRLGSSNQQELRDHPFFGNKLNWDDLQNMKIESPIKKFMHDSDKNGYNNRPRQIYETPIDPGIKLPNIQGISYNPDLGNYQMIQEE